MSALHNGVAWRRSTYCGTGSCVEVATTDTQAFMRDSKDPDSPVLTIGQPGWNAFVASITRGELQRIR